MDNNDQNAGNPGSQNLDNADLGGQGGDGGNAGDPGGQGGQNPDPRDAELEQRRNEVRILNEKLVAANRLNRQRSSGNQPADGEQSPFETPEGQYAISLELATGRLSRELEGRISLYPELPAEEVTRIRKNPWAFASYESFKAGDWETALDEIEQAVANRVEELGAADKGDQNPTQNNPSPATMDNNPASEPNVVAEPGSNEDENPWTMPLGKLGQLKDQKIRQAQTKS